MTSNINPYITPSSMNDVSTLFSVLELADYLGIGRNRAYSMLKNGIISGFRIGATWKVSKAAVDQYIIKNSGLQ